MSAEEHKSHCENLKKKTCEPPKHWGPKCNCMKSNEHRKSYTKSKPAVRPRSKIFLKRNLKAAPPTKRRHFVKVVQSEDADWSSSDSEESPSDDSYESDFIDDEVTEDEEDWEADHKKLVQLFSTGVSKYKSEGIRGGRR